jgi:hypothetical protein
MPFANIAREQAFFRSLFSPCGFVVSNLQFRSG